MLEKNHSNRQRLAKYLLISAVGFFASTTHAVILNPGVTTPLLGTTVAENPQLAGVVLADELIPFFFSTDLGIVSGTVQQRVVRSSVDNTIDFYWRVSNDSSSDDVITSFRIGQFVSPEYDANWRTDGLGDIGPDSAHRFSGTQDSYVNFLFSGNHLGAGLSSKFMFFDTSAMDYAETALFDLTSSGPGDISASFGAYAPVPIPAAGWMLMTGIGMMGALGRRRKA